MFGELFQTVVDGANAAANVLGSTSNVAAQAGKLIGAAASTHKHAAENKKMQVHTAQPASHSKLEIQPIIDSAIKFFLDKRASHQETEKNKLYADFYVRLLVTPAYRNGITHLNSLVALLKKYRPNENYQSTGETEQPENWFTIPKLLEQEIAFRALGEDEHSHFCNHLLPELIGFLKPPFPNYSDRWKLPVIETSAVELISMRTHATQTDTIITPITTRVSASTQSEPTVVAIPDDTDIKKRIDNLSVVKLIQTEISRLMLGALSMTSIGMRAKALFISEKLLLYKKYLLAEFKKDANFEVNFLQDHSAFAADLKAALAMKRYFTFFGAKNPAAAYHNVIIGLHC